MTRIGRTSLTMDHVAVSLDRKAMAVEGTSTLVVFDYVANRPEPVPEAIRAGDRAPGEVEASPDGPGALHRPSPASSH